MSWFSNLTHNLNPVNMINQGFGHGWNGFRDTFVNPFGAANNPAGFGPTPGARPSYGAQPGGGGSPGLFPNPNSGGAVGSSPMMPKTAAAPGTSPWGQGTMGQPRMPFTMPSGTPSVGGMPDWARGTVTNGPSGWGATPPPSSAVPQPIGQMFPSGGQPATGTFALPNQGPGMTMQAPNMTPSVMPSPGSTPTPATGTALTPPPGGFATSLLAPQPGTPGSAGGAPSLAGVLQSGGAHGTFSPWAANGSAQVS